MSLLEAHDNFMLAMEQGPQPYSSKIVTPRGYTTIGELEVGDYVIGADGKPAQILGVYDKGEKDVYEITFADGTTARSCKDHLWNFQSIGNRSKGKGYWTKPLSYLFDKHLRNRIGWRYFIPMCKPVEFENNAELPMDPYLLGVLLGDGGITTGSIMLANSDPHILNRVSFILARDYPKVRLVDCRDNDYRLSTADGDNALIRDLRSLNLMGKRSSKKHIPAEYKLASVKDRIALLQGLFDTDASSDLRKAAGFEYTTASLKLAEDVTFMVQSLGGTIRRAEKIVNGATYYRFYVKFPKGIMPFTLPRKLERYHVKNANPTRSIRRIEKVGREQVRCILIDNEDHLYLTDNFIVTHNTGKTLCALSRVCDPDIKSVLIVAPKATLGAWERDIALFKPELKKALSEKVVLINYDMVWRRPEYDREWDCIILDESHFIKSRTAKRTKFLLALALKAKYKYCLTGTPIGNGRLEDIWAQFTFMQPMRLTGGHIGSEIWGGAYYNFTDKYCYLNKYYKPYKYVRVNEYQDIMNQHSYRILKEECLDLPDKLPEEFYSIDLKEKKTYKELHEFSTLEERDMVMANPLARRAKLRTVCSGFIFDDQKQLHDLKCEKLNVLSEFLENFDKKLVIYAHYKYSIKSICGLLTKKKIKHVSLYGETKNKQVWRDFQGDDSIRVIVCQYQSASSGIDLFAADTMLFYEPTDSSQTYEQCRDRIHRIGQKSKCSYICFRTANTIEVPMYRALKNFRDFDDALFKEYIETWQRTM